jgi:hypothetical protein
MFARTPSELDELSPEVLLGGEGVVCAAAQREVFLRVLAAPREGPEVVELEAVSFGAASSQGVGVSAARFVPLEDGAANDGGDVSTAPARVLGLYLRLPGLGVRRRELGLGLGGDFWADSRSAAERLASMDAALRFRGRATTACFRRLRSATRARIARSWISSSVARGAECESRACASSTSFTYSSPAVNCTL